MSSRPLFGAVFDWDGVICDSGELHYQSWLLLAREIDRVFTIENFRATFGMRNINIIPEVLGWSTDLIEIQAMSDRKEELFRVLLRESGIQPLPGVETFLERLRVAGIPCIVGSSSARLNIDIAIEVMNLRRFLPVYLAAEDVRLGKPHPEVFLTGAARIGVPAARCVVFEDAHVGIAAALAGGMKAVGVATTHPAASLTACGAHRTVQRLDEIEVADLAAWFPQD